MNILVVDDDVNCLITLEDLLVLDGHWTRTATRGKDALDIARRFRSENRRLHLSILDFDIPDMNGLETFEQLTAMIPGIGGIFISGDTSESLEGSIMEAGGFTLVRKPLDVHRVRQAVRAFRGQLRDSLGPPN